jgi:hypothetical protein
MTFSLTHIDGSMEQPPDASNLSRLLNELEQADPEHGDIAVVHESGLGARGVAARSSHLGER